jgi:lysine N6-hydroxylase
MSGAFDALHINGRDHRDAHYQCVGVGVGPSNLSVAALLHHDREIRSVFFEQKPEFSWHDEMFFVASSLQVSMFKDLVTLADPTNYFSFMSYLHANGRIYHFLNAQFDRVSRLEFRNYLKWASDSNRNIRYGEKVLRIDFDGDFVVETTKSRVTAENVVVGVGTEPRLPTFANVQLCDTQFHVSEFASRSGNLAGKHAVVVGGGQSGAEAIFDLISRRGQFALTKITWISKRENFLPMDDSPFTNDYFMPCYSNHFYERDRIEREAFVRRNVLGSDGISEETLRQIYQRIYALRFIEKTPPAVALMPDRAAQSLERDANQWVLAVDHLPSGRREFIRADVIVWATGFRSARMEFLAPLQQRLKREENEFRIDSEFAVMWDGPPHRRIFMLNAARYQRGLPDPNLSLTAWRSQRVIDRIRGNRQNDVAQLPSFISWSPAPIEQRNI